MIHNTKRTRVAERIGFAEHFGCLSPLALSNETLRSEITANDAHQLMSMRRDSPSCCSAVMSNMAAGPTGSRGGIAGLQALPFTPNGIMEQLGASWRRGERTGEKALCTGVAMCHEVCLSKPKRVIRIVCEYVNG